MDYTETHSTQDLIEEPRPVTEKQKIALSKMYANDDMRGYLIHAIQVANKNALSYLKGRSMELAHDSATRANALETLLNTGRLWYIHYDKIEKKSPTKK